MLLLLLLLLCNMLWVRPASGLMKIRSSQLLLQHIDLALRPSRLRLRSPAMLLLTLPTILARHGSLSPERLMDSNCLRPVGHVLPVCRCGRSRMFWRGICPRRLSRVGILLLLLLLLPAVALQRWPLRAERRRIG